MNTVTRGRPDPLGATVTGQGVNFSLYSEHATAVELLLFARPEDAQPVMTIALDPAHHRTYHFWHVLVEGVGAGQIYGYRVYGAAAPEAGLRFDPAKLLLDPYARAVVNTENYQRASACAPGDNAGCALKGVVVDPAEYDWEGDEPIRRPFVDAVIYELHVGGFTRHPSAQVDPARRGAYAGLIEKISYLQNLGVMTIELMPIHQFDAQAAPSGTNYWGYQTQAWFAPHRAYSSDKTPLGPVNEFRDMVKALHRAGIEVILDVVFNHTAEGDATGPTLSLRGIDNLTYYLVEPGDPARYIDDTGVGNTLNANKAIVRRMILDCLRYWVRDMHVDGFRFDLASALTRGPGGQPLPNPPLLLDIQADPVLANTKIIAEAWDATGLYQVADFPGDRWAVWNGRFRDVVRKFVKGDRGVIGDLADAIVGGRSFFHGGALVPSRSVNFVTAHDGFTLNDLVSYNHKHNEANGENNQDGANDNNSWNCGVEGATDAPEIERLRLRQLKNLATILLVAQGRPMWLMGDEVRRTQHGNNNGYCQDNELSWFDWTAVQRQSDFLCFVRRLFAFHQHSTLFRAGNYWGEPNSDSITWHGTHLHQPDWGADSHALAYEVANQDDSEHIFVMLNSYWEPLTFELPPLPAGHRWARLIDTGQDAPHDFDQPPTRLPHEQGTYPLTERSVCVLTMEASEDGQNDKLDVSDPHH